MLFVLRVAEDVSSHNMARVIEGMDDEERPSLWQTLLQDGLSGLGLGLLIGLVFFGASEIALGSRIGPQPRGTSEQAAPSRSSPRSPSLLVTLAGTFMGARAEKRVAEEKRVSHLAFSVTLMVIGSAAFVSLAYITIVLVGGPLVAAR